MKITKNILREMIEAVIKEAEGSKPGDTQSRSELKAAQSDEKVSTAKKEKPSKDEKLLEEYLMGGTKVIQRGSRGKEVEALQRAIIKRLEEHGFQAEKAKMGAVDGIFGEYTLAAVKALQDFYKITKDGVVGRQTWTAIKTDGKEKAESSNVRPSSDKSADEEVLAQTSGAEVGTNVAEFIATNEFRELIKITEPGGLNEEDFANSFVARYSEDDGTDESNVIELQVMFKEKFDKFLGRVFYTSSDDSDILAEKARFKKVIGDNILEIDANKLTKESLTQFLLNGLLIDSDNEVVAVYIKSIDVAWDDFRELATELMLLNPNDSTKKSFIYTGHEQFITLAKAIMKSSTIINENEDLAIDQQETADTATVDTEIDSNPLEESLSFDRLSKLAGLLKS